MYDYARCTAYHTTAARKPAVRKERSEKRKTPARTGMQQQKCRERDMMTCELEMSGGLVRRVRSREERNKRKGVGCAGKGEEVVRPEKRRLERRGRVEDAPTQGRAEYIGQRAC